MKRRYPGRIGLYIADELHEAKQLDTSLQADAMSVLMNAADRFLGLTGTLYGGKSSSLYYLEYIFNPMVRAKYTKNPAWDLETWVQDMGVLETAVVEKEVESGAYSGSKKKTSYEVREVPGTSPLLVREVIDHSLFVGLHDMGRQMPLYEEFPIGCDTPYEVEEVLNEGIAWIKKRTRNIGRYLHWLLGWPDAPWREDPTPPRYEVGEDPETHEKEYEYFIPPVLPDDILYPKEETLIQILNDELAQGRGCAVFVRQTDTRDIQPRLLALIKEHCALARPQVLYAKRVDTKSREDWIIKEVEKGTNVLISNPIPVATGVDLLEFPSIIFYEPMYSLYVMSQASRRAWRLNQNRACKTFYLYYKGLVEDLAISLVGQKMAAANALAGLGEGGLSAMVSGGGDDLRRALAKAILAGDNIIDSRALFQKAARGETISMWDVEMPMTEPVVLSTVEAPGQMAAVIEPPKPKKLLPDELIKQYLGKSGILWAKLSIKDADVYVHRLVEDPKTKSRVLEVYVRHDGKSFRTYLAAKQVKAWMDVGIPVRRDEDFSPRQLRQEGTRLPFVPRWAVA